MKKNILKGIVLVAALGLLAGAFYWFEYRPSQIRAYCADRMWDKIEASKDDFFNETANANWYYNRCVNLKGLEK